jgi:hypothetical protein
MVNTSAVQRAIVFQEAEQIDLISEAELFWFEIDIENLPR